MLLNKKTLITLLLVGALVVLVLFYTNNSNQLAEQVTFLDELRAENSELSSYIDDLERSLTNFKEDDVMTYADLGLAWKSLADQTRDKEHYKEAYKVYEEAVDITQRKNTLFILNAGNMAVLFEDYPLAKSYYEEAVAVAPGDIDGYQNLIELHMYQLKSPKEDILVIFDKGINRMINPDALVRWKESYLKSLEGLSL